MDADIRRIIAVEAHRRRTGRCPTMIHSLGTGETFDIESKPDGFIDHETGQRIRTDGDRIRLRSETIEIRLSEDVTFAASTENETITGRCGGGSSVTLYYHNNYYQYAVVNEQGTMP